MQIEYEKRRALTEVKFNFTQKISIFSFINLFRMKKIVSMNDIDSKILFNDIYLSAFYF